VKLVSLLAATGIIALGGFCVGMFVATVVYALPNRADYPFLVEYVPLPHHVPRSEGSLAFRFAMLHDVIHERFAKHGPAHYQERNRLTREQLGRLAPDDSAGLPLADDLAVGLERLGKPDEAALVMRNKLARQQALGLTGRELYTSYANLGTFLIHGSFPKAVAGDPAAREQVREGLGFIRQSVAVNPEAHFGREQWQVALAEFLLAAMDNPDLLQTFDFLGNRLDLDIEYILNREAYWVDPGYGRPTNADFSQGRAAMEMPAFFQPGGPPDDPSRWQEVSPIRQFITKIGAEQGWEDVAVPSHRARVAFDEPMLGIIGMWRQGGGANPHFALAVAETMLRAGQRYIAWAAYERAARLLERFWPDPTRQQFLRDHCRKRQVQIEETLLFQPPPSSRRLAWQHISPPPPVETVAGLRPAFEAELAGGEGYQQAYQRYETERIAAGVPISDTRFFDEFHRGREPIASPVGPEEWFAFVPGASLHEYTTGQRWIWALFGAGLAAMATAVLLWWKVRRSAA